MYLRFLAVLSLALLCHAKATDEEKLQTVFKRLSSLEQLLTEAEDKIQEQEQLIQQLNRDNAHQEMAIRKLNAQNDKQLKDLEQQTSVIAELKDEAELANAPIAFTAFAGASVEYSPGDVINFELTVTNHGLNYNPSTSKFICPSDALYLFSATLHVLESDATAANIVMGGTPLVQVFAPDTLQKDQATNMVVVECLTGSEIWVEAVDTDGPVEGFADNAVTTFSGFLIIRL